MAADVSILPATEAHVAALVSTMREADVREVMALGMSPQEALSKALPASELSGAALFGGEVACIFGVVAGPGTLLASSTQGEVWMLSGDAVWRHRKAFLRCSRRVMDGLLSHYSLLCNVIDARYVAALRWAEWLGFEVAAARPFGAAGLPFCLATARRH